MLSFALALLALLLTNSGVFAQAPTLVSTWDAATWVNQANAGTQFTASIYANPDGTTGAQLAVTPRDAANPYNNVYVHQAGLTSGHQFTAVVTFSFTGASNALTSCYMYARNSLGNQYDTEQDFRGFPGSTRVVPLYLDLPQIGGTWTLYMGIRNAGSMIINKLNVYSGLTSDGTTAFVRDTPTLSATPVYTAPSGVTKATGSGTITITAPTGGGATFNPNLVADAVGNPDTVAENNAVALQSAIDSCRNAGGPSTLLIPAGTYKVAPLSGFNIHDTSDLTFDGQGATLLIRPKGSSPSSLGVTFTVSTCHRMIMKNLTMDWDWSYSPIASLGQASNVNGYECDFTFPSSFTAAQIAKIQTTNWISHFSMETVHMTGSNVASYNPPTNSSNVVQYPVITAGSAANVLHAKFSNLAAAPVLANGLSYCIRHVYYGVGAFKIISCTDLEFNTVVINSIPGMGWFSEGKMKGYKLYNCSIKRPSSAFGATYPLTTAADGVHSRQSQGNMIVQNCYFTGTGDDVMNIHDETYEAGVTVTGATSVQLKPCYNYDISLDPGDPLEFYNADFSFLASLPTATVTAHNSSNPPYVDVTFPAGTVLPSGITSQTILHNGALFTSKVNISGNTIEYTNGRGMLLSVDNATVSGNFIRGINAVPIDLEIEIIPGLWAEGTGGNNIWIKGNTILDSNKLGRYDGAFVYANPLLPYGPTTASLYNTITLEGNVFYDCPGPSCWLNNCSNLVVTNNDFRLAVAPANTNIYAGTIRVTKTAGCALGGNTWRNLIASPSTYGVLYDPVTVSNIIPDTNALVNQY